MSKKPLIVLDLDDTLIYSTELQKKHLKKIRFQKMNIYFRPYLLDFIKFVEMNFQIAIWTSATELNANFVVNNLFTEEPIFIYTRKDCSLKSDPIKKKSYFYKNLDRIHEIEKRFNKIIFIDDKPELIISKHAEIIPILAFKGDKSDALLIELQRDLERFIPN